MKVAESIEDNGVYFKFVGGVSLAGDSDRRFAGRSRCLINSSRYGITIWSNGDREAVSPIIPSFLHGRSPLSNPLAQRRMCQGQRIFYLSAPRTWERKAMSQNPPLTQASPSSLASLHRLTASTCPPITSSLLPWWVTWSASTRSLS